MIPMDPITGIQQIRRGFKSLTEAETFKQTLAHPHQFEIEAIYGNELLEPEGDYLAYCVIPRVTRQSSAAH
jgi:hypothetical protein